MSKLSVKKNLSSMQVLKTLQVLLQGNFSMSELVERLNRNETEPVFNNSVISKYINTCRFCGIDIPKIHNKYFVASMPFGLELTNSDINLLENLQNIIKTEMSARYNKIFDKFVEKLNRYSNKKIARVEKDGSKAFVEYFEDAVFEKRKIKLMFKNRAEMVCVPLKIAENNGKMFFNVFYKNKERMISMSRVSGIAVLSEKFVYNYNEPAVVFVLKGNLAERYTLRENESIISSEPGSITVSNKGDNKDILLARLLRYDDKCEILNPKPYRDEMIQILDNALKNYGEV